MTLENAAREGYTLALRNNRPVVVVTHPFAGYVATFANERAAELYVGNGERAVCFIQPSGAVQFGEAE